MNGTSTAARSAIYWEASFTLGGGGANAKVMEWLIVVSVMAAVFGCFGAWVAIQKQRGSSEGFVLGLLFGPLGVLVEALLPQGTKQSSSVDFHSGGQPDIEEESAIDEEEAITVFCLACGNEIPPAETRCLHCGWSYEGREDA